jgi:2'-5' RNA ligase
VDQWGKNNIGLRLLDGNIRTSYPRLGFGAEVVFTNEASPHYMRLFTALDLPGAARDRLAEVQAPAALDARWSPPDQFHVTIRFIGNADPEAAERYEAALTRIEAAPATCVPYGLDVLPSRRNPNVLIAGLERTDDLMAVYRAVSDALEAEGLGAAPRDYRPHVTLARLHDTPAEAVHDFLADRAPTLPRFSAEEVHLYESTLTDDGAVHKRRASVPLRPTAQDTS